MEYYSVIKINEVMPFAAINGEGRIGSWGLAGAN